MRETKDLLLKYHFILPRCPKLDEDRGLRYVVGFRRGFYICCSKKNYGCRPSSCREIEGKWPITTISPLFTLLDKNLEVNRLLSSIIPIIISINICSRVNFYFIWPLVAMFMSFNEVPFRHGKCLFLVLFNHDFDFCDNWCFLKPLIILMLKNTKQQKASTDLWFFRSISQLTISIHYHAATVIL